METLTTISTFAFFIGIAMIIISAIIATVSLKNGKFNIKIEIIMFNIGLGLALASIVCLSFLMEFLS